MNYTDFCFRAEVDFLKLRIHLGAESTFPALQRFARSLLGYTPHVQPIEAGPSGASRIFVLTFQSPQRWREVDNVLRRLDERFPFTRAATVDGVEIALDGYSEAHSADQLAELAAHMYWGCQRPVSPNRRIYRDVAGMGQAVPTQGRLRRRLLDGWQIGIGNRGDGLYQHGYVKTTDKGRALPIEHHCARFEVRVQGEALSVRDWSAWRAINGRIVGVNGISNSTSIPPEFIANSPENVAKLLSFRRLDEAKLAESVPFAQVVMEAHSQIGERKIRNRRGGGTRLHSRFTEADAELNARAREALRKLWARWGAEPRKSPSRTSRESARQGSACGISGVPESVSA